MQIFSITLTAFGRIGNSWMNLDAPVVAIIGPNEAGKSTVLKALRLLTDDEPIAETDVTRGMAANDLAIQARFRLDDSELTDLGGFDKSVKPIWLIVEKRLDGVRRASLIPAPKRDHIPFTRARDGLSKIETTGWFPGWATAEVSGRFRTALEALSRPDDINGDVSVVVGQVAGDLAELATSPGEVRLGKYGAARANDAASLLRRVVELLQEPSPASRADALIPRMPPFVEFTQPYRVLKSAYNLDDETDRADVALKALSDAAELDLSQLRSMISSDEALAMSLLSDASERLTDRLREHWKQVDDIDVRLAHQGPVLQVFVRTDKRDFFLLQSRSDGLRAFVALMAFSNFQSQGVKPILLVDEAEAHLHYDAQADLVRVFERQSAAANVIFTTHSVGCIPQDLGRGVRVVEPTDEANRSTIRNSWWDSGRGLKPLVFAMGATALGLIPTRFAVFAEGPSDPMLMPTLLRQAIERETLPYQILPGLAEATEDELRDMASDTPHVAFLVDGDPSGSSISKRIIKLGISPDRIVSIGLDEDGHPLVLEDLILPNLYVDAVNEEITSWKEGVSLIDVASIPAFQRPNAVDAHLRAAGRKESLSKTQVASELIQNVMRPTDNPALLDPLHKRRLLELHERLWRAVGLPGGPWDS